MSGRLVLVVPAFPRLSETFIVSKFLGLLERGWDVHVVCGESSRAEWCWFPELDRAFRARRRVHVTWVHRPRWLAALLAPAALLRCLFWNPVGCCRYIALGWRRFGLDSFRRLYLDAELLSVKPDLVHFAFGALAVGRMYVKNLLGCKVVVSFRGYDLNLAGLEEPGYYREVWETANGLHFLGQDVRRRAQRRGCPADRCHAVIPPAIDAEFFDPGDRKCGDTAGEQERPLRILGVGRLDWRKGYEYALQAVKLLRDLGTLSEYRIIGNGRYIKPLAFARHQLDLEETVGFLGTGSRQGVRAAMLWADVLLHAAVSEGFCNAVIEAQAMGLPVVCTDAGGLPENVVDGETGFVVPGRDPRALAEKLAMLARDPGLRQRMGQAGRRRVLACFQLGDQLAAFERFYRKVLSGEALGVASTARPVPFASETVEDADSRRATTGFSSAAPP